jgi:hypothetical protein
LAVSGVKKTEDLGLADTVEVVMHKVDDREGRPKEVGANPEHGPPVKARRARTAAEVTLMVELCCDEWNVRKCEGKCKLCVLCAVFAFVEDRDDP